MMDLVGDGKRCEEVCKHAPLQKGKWPCEDCDMKFHDRADPPKEEAPAKDTNALGTYDLLYEEGGYSSNGV